MRSATSWYWRRLEARGSGPRRPARASARCCATASAFCAVALHPQRQRLDALQEQERVERRERGAGVAQQHGAHAADVGGGPERVAPDDAVVARVGLRQARVAVGVRGPVEGAGVDDGAADRRAVAADELRQRVDDDVGAVARRRARRIGVGTVLSTTAAGRRRARRRPRRAMSMTFSARVADRLDEHEPRLVVDERRELRRVVGVGPAHLDAVLRQRVREEVVGAAVERRDRRRCCRRRASTFSTE